MMSKKIFKLCIGAIFLILLIISQGTSVFSQKTEKHLPDPTVIQAGKKGKAPSDAIILFDKGSLSNFESISEGLVVSSKDGSPAAWKVNGKKFTVVPGTTNIQTKEKFGDCQLHIEWKTPPKDVREGKIGQACGNSGIYLMGKYEVQVLNSFKNTTYPDGQAGAIYQQYPPLVNASRKPGKWQVYDIIFTSPRLNTDESENKPGFFTVFHNGVLIQNHVEIKGTTHANNGKSLISHKELPLMLQCHQNEVSFRNIWIRRL